ncbi:MAG: chemotaxis protein CheW [Candidatus Methanoperedens sp.]|nr:chemotaxis protein CheW [Candidatus Methanoperedens sp.]
MKMNQLIVFSIYEQRYAFPLSSVERVVRAVEVTVLPKAPDIVLGVVNVQGRIIPVVDIRRRFGLREREIDLNDQLVIAYTSKRSIALVADSVSGVIGIHGQEIIPAEEILPGMEYVKGIVKQDDGMIHILDIDSILSFADIKSLDDAMKEEMGGNK